jgi:hypothetical protein
MNRAVFVIVKTSDNKFAATTRAADRGEEGKIGLPGGKVDPGETLRDAAIRESAEEGWNVMDLSSNPIYCATVDDFEVSWFVADRAIKLATYKEQHRISPIEVTLDQIYQSGYGNDQAVIAFKEFYHDQE